MSALTRLPPCVQTTPYRKLHRSVRLFVPAPGPMQHGIDWPHLPPVFEPAPEDAETYPVQALASHLQCRCRLLAHQKSQTVLSVHPRAPASFEKKQCAPARLLQAGPGPPNYGTVRAAVIQLSFPSDTQALPAALLRACCGRQPDDASATS